MICEYSAVIHKEDLHSPQPLHPVEIAVTWQVRVLVVLVRVTFSGTWYHSSSLAEQFTCSGIIVITVTTDH